MHYLLKSFKDHEDFEVAATRPDTDKKVVTLHYATK